MGTDPSVNPAANPGTTSEINRRMAKAGLRWTRARRIVVDTVGAATAPVSVPDLQATIGRQVPLSSLYRVIADLLAAKILIKLEFAEGFARFELDEELAEHHHHLVCTTCGLVIDVELHDAEAALLVTATAVMERTGFAVTMHRLDFFGTCASCAARDVACDAASEKALASPTGFEPVSPP
jgi:Fur family transcriptional regulator, ferric uptake regulator